VSVETLRFYERRGLLAPPARTSSGYRQYPQAAVRVVRFVKHAQELGFTLDDIAGLLGLADCGSRAVTASAIWPRRRSTTSRGKIRRLTAINTALHELVAACELPLADRRCPLLAEVDHANPPAATI
jgi:DNA-binding transcriptional MerR regulator